MKIEWYAEGNRADPPILFAAKELKEYLFRMGCPNIKISLMVTDLSKYNMEAVEDPDLDDQYYIDVSHNEGVISGNNPRAVLLGVYRYLNIIGCRFLRPGRQYEIIPVYTDINQFFAKEAHTASLRHRGVCIEGCDSIDHIADFLDWLPKAGYNSFFFQFENPHTFLERWFDWKNQYLPSEKQNRWTLKDSQNMMQYFDEWMRDRGLLRHRVGHGWTAKVLGAATTTGWGKEELALSGEARSYVAEINGERALFQNRPVNTNLCLTNPKALEAFSKQVLLYIGGHPDTEYLHIWLADGEHNSCECEDCRKLRPSDHYISLLNYLDEKLTQNGITTKLCFLMYTDLLWAPIKNKLKNKERFLFMFAPITRSFESSYNDIRDIPKAPEFRLNNAEDPKDNGETLSLFYEWKAAVDCDRFIYDYPLGRAHHSDPTHINISKIIYRDLQSHKKLGLNGICSCQELRVSFPNALAGYVMGRASLNLSLSFESIAEEYYQSAYGDSGIELFGILERLSDLFEMDYINYSFCPVPRVNPALALNMEKAAGILAELKELIHNRKPTLHPVQTLMWEKLHFFADYTAVFARMLQLRAANEREKTKEVFDREFLPLVTANEFKDSSMLDVKRNIDTIRDAIINN